MNVRSYTACLVKHEIIVMVESALTKIDESLIHEGDFYEEGISFANYVWSKDHSAYTELQREIRSEIEAKACKGSNFFAGYSDAIGMFEDGREISRCPECQNSYGYPCSVHG